MGALRTPREAWVTQGLRMLAADGIDAVRVESLAKALGVTKGGFYGYFADRNALLTEMLDAWERATTDEVLAQVEQETDNPLDQAMLAGKLTFADDRLDLAVRDWARRDPDVAERLRRVDNRRMQLLRDVIGTVCSDPAELEARCLLAFCVAFGTHLVAADHPGRTRPEVLARVGELLFGGSGSPN